MYRIPFADSSPDRDDLYGEPTLSEVLASRPKAGIPVASRLCLAVRKSRVVLGHLARTR